jgi:hypothetical protein
VYFSTHTPGALPFTSPQQIFIFRILVENQPVVRVVDAGVLQSSASIIFISFLKNK